MALGLLVLRALVGLLFVGHGAQKLFGAFGGYGVSGTAGFFESLGLRPGRQAAIAAGLSELVGGALIALGLLTPLGAVLITAPMVTAIITVHFAKGVWNSDGGYELNAAYIAVVFALAAIGAGAWSLDAALGLDVSGVLWAVGELVVGAIGGSAVVLAGRAAARHASHGHTGGASPTTA